jgi:hypothetical protein
MRFVQKIENHIPLLSENLIRTSNYMLYSVLDVQPCGARKYHSGPSVCLGDELKYHRMKFHGILYLRICEELLSYFLRQKCM